MKLIQTLSPPPGLADTFTRLEQADTGVWYGDPPNGPRRHLTAAERTALPIVTSVEHDGRTTTTRYSDGGSEVVIAPA